MELYSSELKKAREAKHLSLSDVSEATAINVRFLEAIESGNTTILPTPYIRAFIREYAAVVGLDPNEVLKHFEGKTGTPAVQEEKKESPEETATATTPAAPATEPEHRQLTVRLARYATVLIILAVAGIGIWNLWRPFNRTPEVPIIEGANDTSRSPGPAASEGVPPTQVPRASARDSLTLSGTAKDSVWIQVQIDTRPPHDYLLYPGQKFAWRAGEKFTVTLGRAEGVDLSLNGKKLGSLGKRGEVVRNKEISRQFLTQP